ncbi:MAG: M36 family metallopeptidase, partial [Planctomycetota bacterium]
MKKQAVVVLVMMGVIAGPTWAIRPEKPLDSVRLLSTPGVYTAPFGAAGHIGVTAHPARKDGLRGTITGNSNKIWQQFTARAGRGWSVRWNPITGTPHLVTGKAMALPGVKRLTKENIEAACLGFVAANADLLKVRPGQLELANKTKAGGRWFVSFRQVHEGVPILGGGLTMSFTRDDRVIMFGSDVVSDVAVQTQPKVAGTEALRLALADCQGTSGKDRVSEVQLCILPLSRPEGLDYLLCWKLDIFQPMVHKKWQYLIDAVNGNIVGKQNVLVYGNITGTSSGEYKPEFASDATEVSLFPHEHVGARGPEVVIASWNFWVRSGDPGWTTEGQWALGTPTGSGSMWSGCGDPSSGYTGNTVYGYNLEGDYEDGMPAYYLTTTPIDCSGHDNVYLEFMRMLGVESSYFDNASIEVSNDGSNWTTIWANPTNSMCDEQWVPVSYEISDVAGLQPVVYSRWVMGPTDWSVSYPGWNIDDVKVVSYLGGINAVETQADGSYSVQPPWEPSTIISELEGLYCNVNYECGPDALFEQSQVHPNSVVDFTWNSSFYNEIVESSMYWHANHIHDYYLALDPSLSDSSVNFPLGLDYPMQVNVQAGCSDGFCNAYWDGEGMTFGAGDGDFCDDFGLYSEIVYHEYTHGVTDKIYDGVYFPYSLESGAMNEGWSDYFGCLLSPSQSPLVGEGGALLDSPEGFRSLANTNRRETDWYDQVHADSQMFSGALWEVRQAVENVIGMAAWDEMVHFARYAHAQTFEEYLLAILIEDDIRYGDRNLTNGTPHGEIIYTAFGDHGIGGIQCLASSVVFDDTYHIGRRPNGKMDPGETGNLSLSLINGWANATNVRATLTSA